MRSFNYALLFVLIQKTQSRSFLIQLETTLQWLQEFEQTIIYDEKY